MLGWRRGRGVLSQEDKMAAGGKARQARVRLTWFMLLVFRRTLLLLVARARHLQNLLVTVLTVMLPNTLISAAVAWI